MVPVLVMVPIEAPATVESMATGPEIVPLLVRLVRIPSFLMATVVDPAPPLAVTVPLLVMVLLLPKNWMP